MTDQSQTVRVLQQHLRLAGERLTAGDCDGAAGHVEAALRVDPSSLAALALRERIERARAASQTPGVASGGRMEVAAPMEMPPPGRFVPKGVDPQSWMSFEGRIEERRFRSLLRSAREAVERGDAVAARIAVEEARELRPDSPDVGQMSEVVAALPVAIPAVEGGSFMRSRTFRAAGTLLFGVTLMLALDWLRTDPTQPAGSERVALDRSPTTAGSEILASMSRGRTEAPAVDHLPPAPDAARQESPSEPVQPPVAAGSAASAVSAPTAAAATPTRDRSAAARAEAEPAARSTGAGAGGVRAEVPDDFVAQARVTAQPVVVPRSSTGSGAPVPPRGEVPDDYVAVPPVTARSTVSAPAPAPAAPPASTASREVSPAGQAALPLGNVVREPSPAGTLAANNRPSAPTTGSGAASTTASSTPPARSTDAAAAPAASAAAIVPRDDRTRVMTVVDSYTRALENFDAGAARAVWPTVDERVLGRSFSELESQRFSFAGPCNVDVQGSRATASCRGTVSYVVKVGNREPRTEPRRWNISLSRSGDDWYIDSVNVASR